MNPEVHPAAMLFPMMNEEELKKLSEDIEDNGLIEPVVLYHGQILDGRNRLAACELAGVLPHFTQVDDDVSSPTLYVVSKNLHRRHLTDSQRTAIANDIRPLLKEEAQKHQAHGRTAPGRTLPENVQEALTNAETAKVAADLMNVSDRQVYKAAAIQRVDPEKYEAIKKGEKTVHAAYEEIPKTAAKDSNQKRPVKVDAPYQPTSPTQIKRAEGQKQRMITALSTITGLCRGLSELNMPVALSVCAEEERTTWVERSRELAKQLRAFAAKLEETACQQQPN